MVPIKSAIMSPTIGFIPGVDTADGTRRVITYAEWWCEKTDAIARTATMA
jgi:hypothetical protein